MPNDLLEEAKRLSEAATPGPWQIRDSEVWWISDMESNEVVDLVGPEDSSRVRADAEFIARARTLLPELVEQLERAEQRIKNAGTLLARADEHEFNGTTAENGDAHQLVKQARASLTPDEGADRPVGSDRRSDASPWTIL